MVLGYAPTMDDVEGYYGRDDVAKAILGHAHLRRIVMPRRRGFGDREEVTVSSPEDLVNLARRSLFLRGGSNVPLLYPSFHGSIRRTNGICDMVFEVDMKQSYKRTFKNGSLLLRVFDGFDLPYLVKFSGNTSPHIIIPGEAFPEYVRGEGFAPVAAAVNAYVHQKSGVRTDGSFASGNHYLRLPYSINENTGLVSVPIPRDRFHEFDPTQAEMGRVEVNPNWWRVNDSGRRRVEDFVSEVVGVARGEPGRAGLGFAEPLGDEGHRRRRGILLRGMGRGGGRGVEREISTVLEELGDTLGRNLGSLQRSMERTFLGEDEGDNAGERTGDGAPDGEGGAR